jgi:hypothetical protein
VDVPDSAMMRTVVTQQGQLLKPCPERIALGKSDSLEINLQTTCSEKTLLLWLEQSIKEVAQVAEICKVKKQPNREDGVPILNVMDEC